MSGNGVSVVDWVSDTGVPNGQSLSGIVSEWADEDVDSQSSMVWDVEDDEGSEEDGVFLTVGQFAEMLHESNLWRRHMARCGTCVVCTS